MISKLEFGKLRLSQFIDRDQIDELDQWEYMGRLNIGEAHGFSEWIRTIERPDFLWCLSLDLPTFPCPDKVLERLDVPLSAGANEDSVRLALGDPLEDTTLRPDRRSYRFGFPASEPYCIDCTFDLSGELKYLIVSTELITLRA